MNQHLLELCLLRLDWCKIKTPPKKQWLAENEIGYCRVVLYLYAHFFQHAVVPERFNASPVVIDCVKKMLHAMHVMMCTLMSPATSGNPNIPRQLQSIFQKNVWHKRGTILESDR